MAKQLTEVDLEIKGSLVIGSGPTNPSGVPTVDVRGATSSASEEIVTVQNSTTVNLLSLFGDGTLETSNIRVRENSVIQAETGGSFINLWYLGIDDYTSITDTLFIDGNLDRVGIGSTPTTHVLQVFAQSGESITTMGNPTKNYYFNINNVGSAHFHAFGTTEGGVSIGLQTVFTRIGNSLLSVHGNTGITGSLYLNGTTSGNLGITSINGGGLYFGTKTHLVDSVGLDATLFKGRQSEIVFFIENNTDRFATLTNRGAKNVAFTFKNRAANPGSILHDSEINFSCNYYTGGTPFSDEIKLLHTTDPGFNNEFKIQLTKNGGATNDLFVIKENTINTPLPTSTVGLVPGDFWNDSGTVKQV